MPAFIELLQCDWLMNRFVLTSNSTGYIIKLLLSVHVANSKRAFESWLLSHEVRSQEAVEKMNAISISEG